LGNPSLGISPSLYKKLSYAPLKDLTYIGQYGRVPNVLIVSPTLPVKTAQELIAHLRLNPGKYNYGSPGYGSSPQMSMELFKAMTNTFVVHIPFRGGGPATAAMYAGEIQMMFDNLPPKVPDIKSGKVRGLAVTSLTRNPAVPDLPTLDEIGLKGYDVTSWFGLNAPAGTPPAIITRLNQALNRVTSHPDVRDQLVQRGADVVQGTPDDYFNFVKAEIEKWTPVVRRSGVTVE
ncbi:MAG: tripartite tricarboxylate transporter substrate-binding protein, partial [Burkholderiales bacterium]